MKTTENNKLIAEFMGARFISDGMNAPDSKDIFVPFHGSCRIDTIELGKGKILKYHSSWDWLMEVVEKIESSTDINSYGCFMVLESIGFNAKFILDDRTRILKDSKGDTKIDAVYGAVVQFIKWYNEQNPKP